MAIQTGDIITASDILDKTRQCYDNISKGLADMGWNTEWDSTTTGLADSYVKNKKSVKMSNPTRTVLAEINSVHTSNSYVDELVSKTLPSYDVVRGKPIAVGGLVSCLLSSFTTMTSLRLAMYFISENNEFKTQTLFKSGSNFPVYKTWDNQYTALLSSNYNANIIVPKGMDGVLFINRACSNENAEPTKDSGMKISGLVGWKAAGQIRFDSLTGYYNGLKDKSGTGESLGGGHVVKWPTTSLKSYVPSITDFSHKADVELKQKNVIYARSVNALYSCLSSLNNTVASAYYGFYAGVADIGITVSVRYFVDGNYVKNATSSYYDGSSTKILVNGSGYAYGTKNKFNDAFSRITLKEGYVLDHWIYNMSNAEAPLKPDKNNENKFKSVSLGGQIQLTRDYKYVNIWLAVPDVYESKLMSWGTWAKLEVKDGKFLAPEWSVYNSISKKNKVGIVNNEDIENCSDWISGAKYAFDNNKWVAGDSSQWFQYLVNFKVKNERIPYGQDNMEFCKGMLSSTGYSPGVAIINKSGDAYVQDGTGKNKIDIDKLHGMVDWGEKPKKISTGKVYFKKWATMTDNTIPEGVSWAGMMELSATINESSRSHRGLAVVLVDANRFSKVSYDFISEHVPSVAKHDLTYIVDYMKNKSKLERQKVSADGVYLINRYACHPSLMSKYNDGSLMNGNNDVTKGTARYFFWGGMLSEKQGGFPGRVNTFIKLGSKKDKVEWDGNSGPLRDGWGKPMWFKVVNRTIKIYVCVLRITSSPSDGKNVVAGSSQSWGEGAKFHLYYGAASNDPPYANEGRLFTYRVAGKNNEEFNSNMYMRGKKETEWLDPKWWSFALYDNVKKDWTKY